MKIPYFTESAYQELFDAISLNANKYTKSNDGSWVSKNFIGRQYYKESRIDATLPNLVSASSEESDYVNTIQIYDTLKDKLTPKQATNPFLWTYLTHCRYWDYTIDRWFSKEENPSKDMIKQRFFCGPETGNRIGLLRNSVARFWWIGFLSYNEESSMPYELTHLLLSNTDLTQSIIERKFSMQKNVTVGILLAIKEINDDPNYADVGIWKKAPETASTPAYEWRELCKYLNRFGAVTLLDTMSSGEIKKISKEYILSLR